MTPKERQAFEERLNKAIARAEEDIEGYKSVTQPISPDNAYGRLSRMDAINNKAVMDNALRNTQEKLQQLKYMLQKLDADDFGQCVKCGNPIEPMRMIAMPQTAICVSCAKKARR